MDKRVLFFLGGNLVRLSLLLVAVSTISFILLANSPIDPIDAYFINKAASAEQHALVAAYWGFDKPPLERFLIWAGNILHGDFGTSFIYRAPVLEVIGEKFRLTLLLMLTAWMLSGVIGFVLGVLGGDVSRQPFRQGDTGVLLALCFRACVLARSAVPDGVRGQAAVVPPRACRADREAARGGYTGGAAPSCRPACADTERYGDLRDDASDA